MDQIVAITVIFLGALVRAISPFIRKIYNQEELAWDHRYTITLIMTIIISGVAAILAFPQFTTPEGTDALAYATAFIFGAGLNELITELMAWFLGPIETPEEEIPPS